MEWNEETKNIFTRQIIGDCNCDVCEAKRSALAHIETLEKLVNQAAEQIRDVTAQQSVSDASFDLAGKAVVSLRERVATLEAEKDAAVLALGESQSNGERWRQSMYALEERVLELTKERDKARSQLTAKCGECPKNEEVVELQMERDATQPNGRRYFTKVYQDPDGKMYSGFFHDSIAELTPSHATAFAGIAEVRMLSSVPTPVSEKEQLIADIAKFLAPCCDDRIWFHVLLKRAKALMEKGEANA